MKQFFKFFQLMILVILWSSTQAQLPFRSPNYSYGCPDGDGLVQFLLGTTSQAIPCRKGSADLFEKGIIAAVFP